MRSFRSAVAAAAALSMLAAGCGGSSSPDDAGSLPTVVDTEDLSEPAAEPDDDLPTTEPAAEERAVDNSPTAAPLADGTLEIHFIDVGQANATLLRHDEVTLLIDAGDWQRSDVVSYLTAAGVDQLDLVAITHPHADHIGQFDRVLDTFDVAEVWWSGAETTTQTFGRALDALEASTASYAEPRAGDITELGPLLIEIVGPDDDANFNNLHDSSLAMRITYGQVRILFTGDAETATEARMVSRWSDRLDADIYKAGHHGSSTSTTPAFLAAVNPTVTVYSAGSGNSYGHPNAEVLDRLAAHRTAVYGTDVNGTVVVTTDGSNIEVATERDGTPAPGGSSDTASSGPATDDEPETVPTAPAAPAGTGSCAAGQVDINTADVDALQQIIHIGPDRASDIVSGRPFSSVDALTRLNGMGPARINDIVGQGVACAS